MEHLELHLVIYFKLKIILKCLKSLHIQSTNMQLELDTPDLVHLSLCQKTTRLGNRLQNVEQLHCDKFRDWMRQLASLEELTIQELGEEMIANLFVDLVNLKKLNVSAISSLEPLKDLFEQSSNCRLYCKGLKMSQRFVDNLEANNETASKIDPLSLNDPAMDVDFVLLAQDYEIDSCLPFITKAVCSEIVLDGLSRFDLLQRLPNLSSLVLNGPELEGDSEWKLINFIKEIGLNVKSIEIDRRVSQCFLDGLPAICPNLARLRFTAADDQAKCMQFVAQFSCLKGLTVHRQHLELDTLKRIIINCKFLNFVHITQDAMRCYLTKKDEIIIHDDKYKHISTYSKFKFCNQMF